MEVKTIKNVDKQTWNNFRVMAVENNLKMSMLLKLMINEFKKNSETFWSQILKSEKNLSVSEAGRMMKIVEASRKERGFRE